MDKKCERCAAGFTGKRSDARFCSVTCRNATRQARWFAANGEKSRANWRRYAFTAEGTVTLLINYARDRARRAGLPFSLSRDFVASKLAAGVCELSGMAIERVSPGKYRTHPFAPSLDRIIPSDGYVESNVRLVCFCVNRARSDFGDEVLMVMAKALSSR